MKAKRNRKTKIVDTKLAQAHDEQPIIVEDQLVAATPALEAPKAEVPAVPPSPANASPIAKGAHYRKLAGNPSKAQVIAVFGKAAYAATSWVTRAKVLGISAEDLCAAFKAEPEALKVSWEGHNKKVTDSSSASAKQ
jgi:hypothetical protein